MMKNILTCLAALLITAATQAQNTNEQVTKSKFFFKLYGTYGLITPGSDRVTARTTTGGSQHFTVGKKGLGAGLHWGGGVGLVANDFLNLGVDVDYLKGNKLKSDEIGDGGPMNYFSTRNTIDYSILSVIPNVTFKALSRPTYFMYTRIGIILTTKIKYTAAVLDSSVYPQTTSARIAQQENIDYSFKLNAGVQIAFGAQFALMKNLRGFAELTGNYLPISPSSSVNTGESRVYGSDNSLESRSTATPVTTTYSNSGTYVNSGTNVSDASKVFNANSIGVGIGLVYKF